MLTAALDAYLAARRAVGFQLREVEFYFANQALTNSPGDHDGISRNMVALASYLGHSDARNGYWYFESTPALFAKIAANCEEYAGGGDR